MSKWRWADTGCPLIAEASVGMDLCQPCRFFRGATAATRTDENGKIIPGPTNWRVCCNWPRDGAYVAPQGRVELA